MRLAIVDDDPRVIRQISDAIHVFFQNDVFDICSYKDGSDFVEDIHRGEIYDIVFMDIEMKEMNGVDAIRGLRGHEISERTTVVFVSSHTDHLRPLFALHPFDFIEKPVNTEQLLDVLHKIQDSMYKRNTTITIVENRKNVDIYLSDIQYVQSDGHKLIFYINGYSKPVSAYMKLDDFMLKLVGKSTDFIRIHSSYAVNRRYVSRFLKDSVYIGDTFVPVSSRYKADMLSAIHRGI